MSRSFFLLMGTSAAVSLAKGFVLAQMLPPQAFGFYALVLAIGTFASSPLGFGQIERTNKRFPRLYVDGQAPLALREADGIALLLAYRALALGAAAMVAAQIAGRGEWVLGAAAAALLSAAIGWQSIFASVHRASGELSTMGRATIARTTATIALAAAGAYLFSWSGALIGEIVGASAGAFISRAYAHGVVAILPSRESQPAFAPEKDMWLFAAFLVGSVPVYLDRLVVTAGYGIGAIGPYSLLMLFVTGSSILATIIVQHLGPQLVRLEREGTPFGQLMRLTAVWAAGASALVLAGMIVASWAMLAGPLAFLGAKYSLDLPLMTATAIFAAAQVSMMWDWILLSHDGERYVFAAALAYVLLLAAGLAAVLAAGAELAAFIWAMAGAKFAHIALLMLFARRIGVERRRV
jgi:hypothetical protein